MPRVPPNSEEKCDLGEIFKKCIPDNFYEVLGVEKPNEDYFVDLEWKILEEARHIDKLYCFDESAMLIGAINNWMGLDDEALGRMVSTGRYLEKATLAILDQEIPGKMRNGLPKANALYSTARAVNGMTILGLQGLQPAIRLKTKTGKLLSRSVHQRALQYLFTTFVALHWGRSQQNMINMEAMVTKLHLWFSGPVYLAVDGMVRLSGFEGDKDILAKLLINLCLFQKTTAAYKNTFMRAEDDPLYCSEVAGRVLCIPVVLGMEANRENSTVTDSLKQVPNTLEDKKKLVSALREANVPEKTKEHLLQWRKDVQEELLPKFPKNEDLEELIAQWSALVELTP